MGFAKPLMVIGAGGRNRTDMESPPRDFETKNGIWRQATINDYNKGKRGLK